MRQTIKNILLAIGVLIIVILVFKMLGIFLLSVAELTVTVLALMAVILILILIHCREEEEIVSDADHEISEGEILEEQYRKKVKFIQESLGIKEDSAESVFACFSTAGIANIREIKKVDSICGISAYVIDRRGDRFFLELNESGCLESLRKNDRGGTIIFIAREQWSEELL